ncbi:MAG: hypothetical protein CMM46_17300 [Rhodospirillaceae bacterium]|nr:hypothetical protein [Rhodospirillaceae bacterium]|tara:strand:+ start:24538 stop:26064 length:1527 start_codon:yes stop_codon:yes gene_type:complete
MRFLIGEFSHESNSFCEHPTTRSDFAAATLLEGEAVVAGHEGKKTVVGGFIHFGVEHGHDLVPATAATTFPSGPVEAAFFHEMLDRFIAVIDQAGDLDGVLLSLHGGMSVTGDGPEADDPEGVFVARLADALPPNTPIAVVMDLHSDTSELLLDNTAITLAFNEEPHRDAWDRGLEAAGLLSQVVRGDLKPARVRVRAPMLLPAINMATDHGPMEVLHALRKDRENRPEVIDISIHAGFYGADQSQAGFSVVATTRNEPNLAETMARDLALDAWNRRETFLIDLVTPEAGVTRALRSNAPTALVDEADDPAGGGSCGSVVILKAMMDGGITSGGVSSIHDSEIIECAASAGEGGTVTAPLGAKTDRLHGTPVHISGRVVRLSREPVPTDTWSGRTVDVGLVAAIDVDGIIVLVTERKLVTENIDLFAILGFDVTAMQAVVFKGLTLHVRQALAGKIDEFLPIDGIGITHPDVTRLGPYLRLQRPCWPFDPIDHAAWLSPRTGPEEPQR